MIRLRRLTKNILRQRLVLKISNLAKIKVKCALSAAPRTLKNFKIRFLMKNHLLLRIRYSSPNQTLSSRPRKKTLKPSKSNLSKLSKERNQRTRSSMQQPKKIQLLRISYYKMSKSKMKSKRCKESKKRLSRMRNLMLNH